MPIRVPCHADQTETCTDQIVEQPPLAVASHLPLHEHLTGLRIVLTEEAGARRERDLWHPYLSLARGKHSFITYLCLLRIADADDLAQFDREINHALHMRKPLARIGVEQALLRFPRQYQVELPAGAIHGVSHSRAQSLTGKRRRLVCRVTREEKAPVAPGIGPARPEGVEGVAFKRGILRHDVPGSQQFPRLSPRY